MDLSIIIVNWNSSDYLKKCLESIYAHAADVSFEVIVVDNASYDGCAAMLSACFPEVRFVQSDKNLGFARANNLGFTHSAGRVLLFLNPDTEITRGSLQQMMSVLASQPHAGIAGCKLLNGDLTLQTSCVQAFPTILNEALDATCLRKMFPRSRLWGTSALCDSEPRITDVECVSGACLMIRRAVFEAVGQFSAGYFMYVEDRDLCYKVRLAGHNTYFTNSAEVIHYGGTSSTVRPESNFETVMRCESLFSFMRERRGTLIAWSYRMVITLSALARMLFLGIVALLRHSGLKTGFRYESFSKWKCVLLWSTRRHSWTQRYAPKRF